MAVVEVRQRQALWSQNPRLEPDSSLGRILEKSPAYLPGLSSPSTAARRGREKAYRPF